ncbi:branched-chain amino acid ABC transporter permease [Niveibacterium umoris]|nr:branched-chain amino acid ABC transporter permease [Niveibacterium umoris]
MMDKRLWIGLALAGLIAPYLFYEVTLAKLVCFALFAVAFNLLIGYAGLLSFGHAAFFGSAAYVCGYVVRDLHLGPELGVVAGTLAAGLLGALFGSLAIRRQGIYFAMITLALAQIVYFIALKSPITGGEDGMQGVKAATALFGLVSIESNRARYYFALVVALLGFAVVYRAIHSPFGAVLKAIRENEPRALSLGYKVERVKLLAFVLSAALAGTAGSLKAIVLEAATLTDIRWTMSGEVVLMTLLGGMGTVTGPIVGAFTVAGVESWLANIGQAAEVSAWLRAITSAQVVMGLIFIFCVLLFRRGIVGELQHVMKRNLNL